MHLGIRCYDTARLSRPRDDLTCFGNPSCKSSLADRILDLLTGLKGAPHPGAILGTNGTDVRPMHLTVAVAMGTNKPGAQSMAKQVL
jgi:hypothetical protein